MYYKRLKPRAYHRILVAACLAVLAGCIPQPGPTAATPANLTAAPGNGEISLNWAASEGATGYNLKRATINGGPYAQIIATTVAGYVDTSVINGTTYYYVVVSLNSAGESPNSAQAAATPTGPTIPPTAPGNLTATAGSTQVALTWSASSGATGYRVKRSTTSGGPYVQISAPATTSYLDASLSNGTAYFYVVSATNSFGESANSTQVRVIPAIMNPPPTTFGTWINVTPSSIDLTSGLCSNYGAQTVQADPGNPSHVYVQFHCQGIWKSTDYGATWVGPINTGTNGTLVNDCSGGITIPPGSVAANPTIYLACIRGSAVGFWRSSDGGVNWIRHSVVPGGPRQDYYPPSVDPYDQNHLLMAGHEFGSIVESIDGGRNWTAIVPAAGMMQDSLSGTIFFVNTGSAATTRGNWLWMSIQSGGTYGSWRTTNGGSNWAQVDKNESASSGAQIYQPDNGGVVYMVGNYSALGSGVLRSADYGQTWAHVGLGGNHAVVFGTSKNVYTMFGFPVGAGGSITPEFHVAAQPGTGTWVAPGTPAGLAQGPAQVAVVNDGTRNIFLGAMWNSGLWRYIEP